MEFKNIAYLLPIRFANLHSVVGPLCYLVTSDRVKL